MDGDVRVFTATFEEDNAALNAKFGEIHERGGGTDNYEQLRNKPRINNIELIGNKTSKNLKLQDEMDAMSIQEIEAILYL